MAQHFLLSPASCSLTLREVFGTPEDKAYEKFKMLRWPEGRPVCPNCGEEDHWVLVENRKWKCKRKSCRFQYTVTSRTPLASRKMAFRDILAAIAIYTNGVMGVAALRLKRELGTSYKTAFVLAHKIREALRIDYDQQLEGVVEIDGAFIGKRSYRDPNFRIKGDKKYEAYLKKPPRPQTSIVVVRERPHSDPDRVARVRVTHARNEGSGIPFVRQVIMPGAEVHADCGTQWEALNLFYDMKRIDHSKSYSDGIACTNFAESFFARMRAAERGVYRYFTKRYAERYGVEIAWREENSRLDNGRQINAMIRSLLHSPRSSMAGYWQRHKADPFDFAA